MDCGLKNRLYTLAKQCRLLDIISITEDMVLKQPQDLSLRYCAGIAKIFAGDFEGGLSYLDGIIELYNNLSLFCEPDFETKRFVGYSCLQLSLISEFHTAFKLDNRFAVKYSNKAATKARAISLDIEDLELRKQSEEALRRHLVWCVKNENGGIEGGTYPLPRSPYVLQIEPTNHCNLKCTMCPHDKMSRKKGYLDLSLLDEILSSWSGKVVEVSIPHLVLDKIVVKNWKIPGVIKLYFMGEPLLHPEIDTLISKIRNKGVSVGIQTNGILMRDRELRQRLLKARPSGIWFSIDGVGKNTYESVRKNGNWEQLCETVISLNNERKEMGLTEEVKLGIASIIPRDTQDDRRRAKDFLAPISSSVDYIGFTILDRKMGGEFFDAEGKIVPFKETDSVLNPINFGQPLCQESLDKLNILWDGTVTPCCYDISAEMKLGSADEGIDNIWSREKTRNLQSALLNHKLGNLALCQFCKRRFE